MKKLLFSTLVVALLTSCGGETESFVNAKIHKCNMVKYAKEIAEGKDSQAKLEEATRMFETNRELAIESEGMTDFDEKMKEVTCD